MSNRMAMGGTKISQQYASLFRFMKMKIRTNTKLNFSFVINGPRCITLLTVLIRTQPLYQRYPTS